MALTFHDGFETAGAGAWGSVTGSPTFIAGAKYSGNYGMHCDTTGGADVYYVGSSLTYYQVTCRLYISTAPGRDTTILGDNLNGNLVLTTTRELDLYDGAVKKRDGTTQLNTSQWYRISLAIDSSGNAEYWIDGSSESTQIGISAMTNLDVGIRDSVTANLDFDDVAVSNTDSVADIGDIRTLAARPTGNGVDQNFGNDQWQERTGGSDSNNTSPSASDLAEDPPDTAQGAWEIITSMAGTLAAEVV
jgi:hypothetical protein